MKKYSAELDLRSMSKPAQDYYCGSDWKVWKDGSGAFWYGIGSEESGPHTLEEIESIFEQYAAEDEMMIAVGYMDEEIREELHTEMAPCTDLEFLKAYKAQHFEKYGEEFSY